MGKVIPVILPLAKGKAPVKLRFRLDEAATVKLVIQKSTTGVRVGKKCLAKKRGRTGKACVLLVRYGTATQKLKSGGTTMNLVGGLKPGSYVITMTAVDAAKNTSKPTVVKLTVKAPPKK